MKNLLSITLIFSMFMLFSCGEATTTAKDGDKTEISKCGEEGHECTEACHAKEEHDHADHEGQDHGKTAHVCTADCKEGACSFKCGEEGHECSEACKSHELVEHKCSDDCKDGVCSFKCGEKGHECTDLCKAHTNVKKHDCSAEGANCNTGTHKCGDHCGCGDGCECTSEKSCSDNCKIKAA